MALNLQSLLEATRAESDARKAQDSLASLRAKIRDLPPARGFARTLAARPFSLIAEVKAKSPSMGAMGASEEVASAHRIYERHPAVAAISVLTQEANFGGSPATLQRTRRETTKPVLRKDFIFDEYEVYYSRSIEADAILLMANVLADRARFQALHGLATELGMDVLCEVHFAEELALLPSTAKVVGVNSRNFASESRFAFSKVARHLGKDVTTDLAAFELLSKLPQGCLRVAESGLSAKNIAEVLARYPMDAALVGTSLLKAGLANLESELTLPFITCDFCADPPNVTTGTVILR